MFCSVNERQKYLSIVFDSPGKAGVCAGGDHLQSGEPIVLLLFDFIKTLHNTYVIRLSNRLCSWHATMFMYKVPFLYFRNRFTNGDWPLASQIPQSLGRWNMCVPFERPRRIS